MSKLDSQHFNIDEMQFGFVQIVGQPRHDLAALGTQLLTKNDLVRTLPGLLQD